MDLLAYVAAPKSVSYTGTAGVTGAFTPGPNGVMVWATTDAHIGVGAADFTATTANAPAIPAYTPVLLKVPNPLVPFRVSAIQIAAGGTVYACPVAGT